VGPIVAVDRAVNTAYNERPSSESIESLAARDRWLSRREVCRWARGDRSRPDRSGRAGYPSCYRLRRAIWIIPCSLPP